MDGSKPVQPEHLVRYTGLKSQRGYICNLCPNHCQLTVGQLGRCGTRMGSEAGLLDLTYGRFSAVQLDPIEKKPLFHFMPGSTVLSVGSVGCTFNCSFCQNHHLLNLNYKTVQLKPEALIRRALDTEGCSGIAFTYNEGALQHEYILDLAPIAHSYGLKVILVTNGFITREALQSLSGYVDAMNIDLKAFNPQFYVKLCAGQLDSVKAVIEVAAGQCHVELSYLAIYPHNTDPDEFERCVDWIASINETMPLHISRYFPARHLSLPPTPLSTLYALKAQADKALKHVYVGNVPGASQTLFCPTCHSPDPLQKFGTTPKNTCGICGQRIYGVFR